MNRTLKLSMLLALTLGSTQALALGLGQIRVKSALDKPLVAEIPLVEDHPGEADNVQVSLASAQDFARAGLDRTRFPADLQFKVVTDADGQKVIRVTSTAPVRETYLDFLLQVEWPRGKLLREFTVLLDPPHMMSSSKPAASTATTSRAAASKPAARAATPAPSMAAPAAGSGRGRMAGGKYGPVRSGETLSQIAGKALPQGVSMNQMLVAMYDANRGAFVRHNMNLLKRGAVLRIPTREQATATSAAAARAEVRKQYEDWKGMAAGAPTMVSSTGGTAGAGASGAAAPSGDRLKLVPPKQGGGASGRPGVSGGTGDDSVRGLRQDLARTKETLGNLKQESADLKSRLDALQKIHDKNQRLLSLKNAEIAELQQKLAEARKAAAKPAPAPEKQASTAPAAAAKQAVAPATAGTAAKSAPAAAGTATVASVPPAAPAKASKPAPAKPAPAKQTPVKNKPVAKPAPARRAPVAEPWYMQTWAWIAGGALAVFLLVLGLMRARSDGKPDTSRPSLADQFSDEPFDASAVEEEMDEDQRELLAELAEHPDEIGLHLELVSLYYARRDVDHFEAAAEAMYAHISDPEQAEWQEVRAMGEELVPEHPLFASDTPAPQGSADVVMPEESEPAPQAESASEPNAATEDENAFDLDSLIAGSEPEPDMGDETFDAPIVEPEASPKAETEGYNFDFDLTPSGPGQAGGAASADSEPDALPPLPETEPGIDEFGAAEPAATTEDDIQLPDDPIDTKLDLARAYMDMGDPSGARAMLEEVMSEGSQLQRDVAKKLLDDIG